MAHQFLQMLDVVYRTIDHPEVEYCDWIMRSKRTIRDLETSKQARRHQYGNLYIMPYPDGECPDAMVQLTVAQALHEWNKWNGKKHPLEAELKRGLEKFYERRRGGRQGSRRRRFLVSLPPDAQSRPASA
jgi:hypothetical protein